MQSVVILCVLGVAVFASFAHGNSIAYWLIRGIDGIEIALDWSYSVNLLPASIRKLCNFCEE